MQLLFATNNQGKLKETRLILRSLPFEVLSIPEADKQVSANLTQIDVKEIGSTFEQNALLKARDFSQQSGLLTAADDSGLQVQALGGFPGVRSARWMKGSDRDRTLGLLKKLLGQVDRSAQFVTVICLLNPENGSKQFFRGEVTGSIATEPKGGAGFGYDPIFIPTGYNQTFAQLGVETKNQLSHRRQALERLKKYFNMKQC